MSQDPNGDIYKLMDRAGLDAGNMLNSKKSMSKIVSEVRTKLAKELREYIDRRDKRQKVEVKGD